MTCPMIFQDYVSLSRSLSRKVIEQDYVIVMDVRVIQQDPDYVIVLDYPVHPVRHALSDTQIFYGVV